MMKRIICLLLALLLMVPVLASCADDGDAIDNVTDKASRYTNTINMWLVTESEIVASVSDLAYAGLDPAKVATMSAEDKAKIEALDEDQLAALSQMIAISKELNKITKAQFKTKVNLKYFTEGGAYDYYTALEIAMERHKQAIDNGEISKQDPTSEETIYNEYGVPELKYPEAKDYQVDILFIGDQHKYVSYIEKGWLLGLDDKIADSAMELSTYLDQLVLSAAQYDSATYAIPNNHTLGEYTYLLINKQLMADYYFDTSVFTTSSVYDPEFAKFLKHIYDANQDKIANGDEDAVYPIYTESGSLDVPFVHYWNYVQKDGVYVINPEAFSLFGATYLNTDIRDNTTSLAMGNILGSTVYKNFVDTKLLYEKTEGYITDNPDANAAAMVVKGGWEVQEQYGDEYEIMVMATPRVANDDIFSSMFAISANSTADDRAMEVITYLNTNAAVRNLLQYGIEGVNYTVETVEEKGENDSTIYYEYAKATRDNMYVMDINKTGNVFVAYPASAEDVHMWNYGKKQNYDALAIHSLGFAINTQKKDSAGKLVNTLDEKSLIIMQAVSAAMENFLNEHVYAENVSLADARAMYATIQSKASTAATADAIARLLLTDTTGPQLNVSYTYNGTTATLDVRTLAAAISYVQQAEIIGKAGVAESPYALYKEWVTGSVFTD